MPVRTGTDGVGGRVVALVVWDKTGSELAELIRSDRREHLMVVSHLPDRSDLNLDAEYLAREIDGFGDVILITSGPVSYGLKEALPSGSDVYGNGGRVYRAAAENRPAGEPTRFVLPRSRGEARKKADELLDIFFALPVEQEVLERAGTAPVPVVAVLESRNGTVTGFVGAGELAWVTLADGSLATVEQQELVPGVRLDWLLERGQEVGGPVDPVSRHLDLSGSLVDLPNAQSHYGWDKVVLCLVDTVEQDRACLEVLPGDKVRITREDVTSNELDSLEDLLTPGAVVAARLRKDKGVRKLSLRDVDDDEEVEPAPALVEGGLPWLVPGRDLLPPSQDELEQPKGVPGEVPGEEYVQPAPDNRTGSAAPVRRDQIERDPVRPDTALKSTQRALDAARAEIVRLRAGETERLGKDHVIERLRDELADAHAALVEATSELADLRDRNRADRERLMKAQQKVREAEKPRGAGAAVQARVFAGDEDQFRHELYLQWTERVQASEKSRYPLLGYTLGPKFLGSYFGHPADLRSKALRAVVDLLTGRAERMPGRDVHPLRAGSGPEEPQWFREGDGAACWRMSVEGNTPASRRIHYLKLPGRGIELHELVPHEVTEP